MAGVLALLDRPPVDATARLYRVRTVYALGAEPLRLRVAHPRGRRVTVNAVVYADDPRALGATLVRSEIDGGVLDRDAGQILELLTLPVRVQSVPEARDDRVAVLLDGGGRAGFARSLRFSMGPDLSRPAHVMELTRRGPGPRLWVRFFVTTAAPASAPRVLQWGIRDGDPSDQSDDD